MNMHVHLGLKLPGAAGDSLANETDVEEVLRMAGNARLSLLSGHDDLAIGWARITALTSLCVGPSRVGRSWGRASRRRAR